MIAALGARVHCTPQCASAAQLAGTMNSHSVVHIIRAGRLPAQGHARARGRGVTDRSVGSRYGAELGAGYCGRGMGQARVGHIGRGWATATRVACPACSDARMHAVLVFARRMCTATGYSQRRSMRVVRLVVNECDRIAIADTGTGHVLAAMLHSVPRRT